VRQDADASGSVLQPYHYDAYGNAEGFTPDDGLYYTGEMFDADLGQYYLRARCYNPANGRFNRVDPFAGNHSDPQSLHKYLYCHANPVNYTDSLGLFTQKFGFLAEDAIQDIYKIDHWGDKVSYGGWTKIGNPLDKVFRLKPDILNYDKKTWLEIKPLTTFRPFGTGPGCLHTLWIDETSANVCPFFE
jgi:RHS repeat-associated protein